MEIYGIRDLSFSYNGSSQDVLEDINLSIEEGEFVLICGKSGCGKTTLLNHLKPVLTPKGKRSGALRFCGSSIEALSLREQSTQIGYVMQNPDSQIVTDKVWHELAFGLENIGMEQKAMRLRVAEMSNYFGIGDWFHSDVAKLSGGQKQLLNLAAVMAMQPSTIILDEPTSQLDPIAASDFMNTLRKINRELGTTIIMSEHRLEDVYPYADRIVILDEGRIIADSAPVLAAATLWEMKHPMLKALPTPIRLFYETGKIEVNEKCPVTIREGRSWLQKKYPEKIVYEPEKKPAPGDDVAAISVKEVWFRYGRDEEDVIRDFSCELVKGSISAIVGGNGAGKSTALKLMAGIIKPYRGCIKIFGKKLDKYKSGELYKNCIAMLPQDPTTLFVKKTVREELMEMKPDEKLFLEAVSCCELGLLLDRHPYDLSGGEQQRCALAKVLLAEPSIILMDEPTKGMDEFYKQKFAGLMKRLISNGKTILIVSHDIEFIAKYADYVSMFFDGGIVTTNTAHDFFANNSFYTTAANRMTRGIIENTVTEEEVKAAVCIGKENL